VLLALYAWAYQHTSPDERSVVLVEDSTGRVIRQIGTKVWRTAMTPATAATMKQFMIQVVLRGTGTAAQIPGIQVAGKTGTAELGPVTGNGATGSDQQRIDAWFTAFAPATSPKLAVAAMVVNASGDGGTVAAPIVRQVMASAFGVA
jgi:peptidoglycan glycosyltransferase